MGWESQVSSGLGFRTQGTQGSGADGVDRGRWSWTRKEPPGRCFAELKWGGTGTKLGGHQDYRNKKVAEKTPGPPLLRMTNHSFSLQDNFRDIQVERLVNWKPDEKQAKQLPSVSLLSSQIPRCPSDGSQPFLHLTERLESDSELEAN